MKMNRVLRSLGFSFLATVCLLALAGLGLAEDIGKVSLSHSIRAAGAVLEPGLYTVAVEDVSGKTVTAGDETFTISGRSEIVLKRNDDVRSTELAVVPTGRHPNTLPPVHSTRPRVYTQTLRADVAPPAGEPAQLFRIVVVHGGQTLLSYYELL
jgi:hypothetical protein